MEIISNGNLGPVRVPKSIKTTESMCKDAALYPGSTHSHASIAIGPKVGGMVTYDFKVSISVMTLCHTMHFER